MHKNNVKILIIDDDNAILNALGMFLEQEGYKVVTLSGYHDYFKGVKAADYPDLIILDILLSEENGYDVARELKADKKTATIPIAMISAHPKGDQLAEAAGADAYLAKPFDMDSLLGTVENLAPQTA